MAEEFVFYNNSLASNILFASISVVVIAANSFEIAHIYKKKGSKNSYEVLLISLSVSDAFFGVTNFVFLLLKLTSLQAYTRLIRFCYVFSFLLSVLHLISLALDRLVAVTFPLKHKIYWQIKHAKKTIAFIWILVAVITIVIFHDLYTSAFTTRPSLMTTIFSILITADIILVTVYSLVFYQIFKQRRNTVNISQTKHKNKKLQHRSLKNTLLLCLLTALAFIFCTLRFTIQLLDDTQWPDVYSTILVVANSFLNSFIYFFHGKISEVLKKKRSSSTNID